MRRFLLKVFCATFCYCILSPVVTPSGVHLDPVPEVPPEQFADRDPEPLAQQIPESHVNTGDGLNVGATLTKVPGEGVELLGDHSGLNLLANDPLGQHILKMISDILDTLTQKGISVKKLKPDLTKKNT